MIICESDRCHSKMSLKLNMLNVSQFQSHKIVYSMTIGCLLFKHTANGEHLILYNLEQFV